MLLAAIFAGGMLGTAARYALSRWVDTRHGPRFPWGTLSVNTLGSFCLGVALPLLARQPPGADPTLTVMRAFFTVGAIGAFTTFSTFALEAVLLLHAGRTLRAAAYAVASVLLGLMSLTAGLVLGGMLAA